MRLGAFDPHDQPLRISDLASLRLPSYAGGGTVPGAPGAPRVIIAHGGEKVEPREIPLGAGTRTSVDHHVHMHNDWTINATGEVRLTGPLKRDVEKLMNDEALDAARLYRQGAVGA